MSARGVLRVIEGGGLYFWCPGCNEGHVINTVPGGGRPVWSFDGNYDAPTFSPSVLVRSGHHVPGWSGKQCWCTYNKENPDDPVPYKCTVCHSFVRNGMIEFLTDSTHALAGQTVQMELAPARPEVSDG